MTALLSPLSTTDTDDGPAIDDLHRLFTLQRRAFLADPQAGQRRQVVGATSG